MNCDICKIELEYEYYHLHQGLCEECEKEIMEEYYREQDNLMQEVYKRNKKK